MGSNRYTHLLDVCPESPLAAPACGDPIRNLIAAVTEMAVADALAERDFSGWSDEIDKKSKRRDFLRMRQEAMDWLTSTIDTGPFSFMGACTVLFESDPHGMRRKILTEVLRRKRAGQTRRNIAFSRRKTLA